MLAYLAVFHGGETTLLFDQIGLLPHDVDHFHVFHPLFGSEAFEIGCFFVFVSSFIYKACNSTYDSTSCIVVLPETIL